MTAAEPARFAWYWLLPAAFVVHDGEELFTLPRWVQGHHEQLAALLRHLGVNEHMLTVLPTSLAGAAGAIAVLLLLFGLVTAAAARAQGRGPWQFAFMVLLGGFFLHGFTHLAQAAYFGGYAPGAVTAGVVVIPASLYLYRRLHRARLLRPASAVAGAALGLTLLIPAVLLALRAGAALGAH